jgi:integrase/recombinase XerC
MNGIVPAPRQALPAVDVTDQDITDLFFGGKSQNTVAAYKFDWADFARWLGLSGYVAGINRLLNEGNRVRGGANKLALGYRNALERRGLASSTINRRLSALRSAVKWARQLGHIVWALDVEDLDVESYQNTAGPGHDARDAFFESLDRRAVESAIGKRDRALSALHDNPGLRRAECISLDLEHVSLERGEVFARRKGKRQRKWIPIVDETRDALKAWMDARGPDPGPLFIRLDPGATPGALDRLSLGAVNRMMARQSKRSGLATNIRPHGLRHGMVTRLLEVNNGNITEAQVAADHADPKTTMKYNDNRLRRNADAYQRLADADARRMAARRARDGARPTPLFPDDDD